MNTVARQRPPVRRLVTDLAWWCALYALWFLFCGQAGWPVAAWGAVAAVVGVVAGRLVAGRGLVAGRPNVRWAASLPRAARQTVLDFGMVAAVLARSMAKGERRRVGRFVRRDVGSARSEAAHVTAWLAMTATYSPNAYVLDIDPSSGQALLHDLRPLRAWEEPV